MNEIITQTMHLPDTIEDLTQFVLVGKSRLNAYMMKLRTVNRLSVAQEIRNQTLEETQELANALIAAEQRIGELLLAIPKASGGDRKSENFKNDSNVNFEKTKAETISDMGYGEREARDYQQMAKNPEIVRRVIEEATANGEVVTKSAVMRQIQQAKAEAREEAKSEIESLRQTNRTLKSQAAQTVTFVRPTEYEDTLRQLESARYTAQRAEKDFQDARKENAELRKQNEQLRDQIGTDKVWKEADRDIRQFTSATNQYIRMYGGHAWVFSEIENVSEGARSEFLQAIRTLDGFAQQLLQNLGGLIDE